MLFLFFGTHRKKRSKSGHHQKEKDVHARFRATTSLNIMPKNKHRAVLVTDPKGERFAKLMDDNGTELIPCPSGEDDALVGDVVTVRLLKQKDLETPIAIVDSIESFTELFYVGGTISNNGDIVFSPESENISSIYNIFKTKRLGVSENDRVLARVVRKKYSREHKVALERNYGKIDQIPPLFEATVDSVFRSLKWDKDETISLGELENETTEPRKDYRSKVAFSLCEGDEACGRAYSLESRDNGLILYCHIADVDALIPESNVINEYIKYRLKNPNICGVTRNMLPENLHSTLGFVEDEDRNAITVRISINNELEVDSVDIFKSTINLTSKNTFSEVDLLLKGIDRTKTRHLYERAALTRETATILFEFVGRIISSIRNNGGFVGTKLDPSFSLEFNRVSDIVEKKLYDGELLSNCLDMFVSKTVGKFLNDNGFPALYQGEWPLSKKDFELFSTLVPAKITKENLGDALNSLYLRSERGVYERSAYNLLYARFWETYVSTTPMRNTLAASDTCFALEDPLKSFLGLSGLRILKSFINNDSDTAHRIARETVENYWKYIPNLYNKCRNLYYRLMFTYTSSIKTPAEVVITAVNDDYVLATLVNGCIGYFIPKKSGNITIDADVGVMRIGSRSYTYGDYVTIKNCFVDDDFTKVYFQPVH